MFRHWIGTSGYSYKEWKGIFYPSDLPDGQLLRYYSSRLSTVEINHTFYRMPTVRILQGWAKETPDEFAFSLKAPRRITHDLRLRDAADVVGDFCEVAQTLRGKLGPILFQLPPFLKRDTPRLEDFLHQMEPGFRVAFEFRNTTWFCDEVYECLRRFDVALCIVDSPDRPVPWEATAGFGYFRLRQPDYSDDDLASCATRIRSLGESWKDVFVYFKHEGEGQGPVLATKLRELLSGTESVSASI